MTIQTTHAPGGRYGLRALCNCGAVVHSTAAPAALMAELDRLGWRDGRCGRCHDREGTP